MRALSDEVCKNIILAGVGSITLLEHDVVTEEDLGAQFLVRQEDIGRNVCKASRLAGMEKGDDGTMELTCIVKSLYGSTFGLV